MKRKAEEKSFTANKESRKENIQEREYTIGDPIVLRIIECARNQNHKELQKIPNLDINKIDYKIGLSAGAILASNKEVEAIKFLGSYGVKKDSIVFRFAMGGHGEVMMELLNQGASKDEAVVGAIIG